MSTIAKKTIGSGDKVKAEASSLIQRMTVYQLCLLTEIMAGLPRLTYGDMPQDASELEAYRQHINLVHWGLLAVSPTRTPKGVEALEMTMTAWGRLVARELFAQLNTKLEPLL